jgi:uncharacterized protein
VQETNSAVLNAAYWNGGDAIRTRFFDALSVLLPEGELFVIDTVQQCGVAVGGTLDAESRQIIDDEHAHRRAHGLDLKRLQSQLGPAGALTVRAQAAVAPLHNETLETRLALAAAFEHLTVLLAQRVLRNGDWIAPSAAAQQARLWRWHCAEELAHAHVLPALLRSHGIGWWRRIAVYGAASLWLAGDVIAFMHAFLREDRRVRRLSRRRLVSDACAAAPILLRDGPALVWGWIRYFGPLQAHRPSHPAAGTSHR